MCMCAGSTTQGIAYLRKVRLPRLSNHAKIANLGTQSLLRLISRHGQREEARMVGNLPDSQSLPKKQAHLLLAAVGGEPPAQNANRVSTERVSVVKRAHTSMFVWFV